MSGLELLGFACNIMQVISFSREVISLCNNVYQGKHPDTELADLAASLQAVSSDVQTGFDTINPKTADEKRLCDIATRCAIAARDLEEEVSFITSRQKQGSLASTMRVAAKTTWRKRRLDRLEKSLKEHERVLDTHLTVRVCKKADAIALRQKEGFDKLGADIQHFASQYALGHQKLRELVRTDLSLSQKESEKVIEAHVTEEITRSQVALLSHINTKAEVTTETITQNLHDFNIQTEDNDSCKRFLQSLKYPAMNERRNHLAESHEGTFKWAFSQHELLYNDDSNKAETKPAAYQDPPWDNFEDWLKSDSDIYWVSGKPGSGKSTFMKFLISNPLTIEALQSWRPDIIILSHFFWKPGSMIQRNVKGLFASLLHQLLTLRQDLLQAVLAGSRDLGQKDSNTDWSVKELQFVCLSTMRSYGSSICLFIDGLDEICDEDGVGVLMEILSTIKMIPGVKICVASRPEQRLKLYLSQVPRLKLHELTSADIWCYANQTLMPLWKRRQDLYLSVLDEQILPVLLSKAEGVFLWIRFAVQNLISGLENGDKISDLVLRLQDLPAELSQMYADMWTRLNGNTRVHRESTAKLLNLLISHQEIESQGYDLRVADIVGAIELPLQSSLFIDGQRPTSEMIIHSCIQTRELMELRCIGLVDILEYEKGWNDFLVDKEASLVSPHASLAVKFIHRTAYDFLTDTEEGHRILSYDSSLKWEKYFQFIKGRLVANTILHYDSMYDIMIMIARASHLAPRETTHSLLKVFWKLYNEGLFREAIEAFPRHFLSLAVFPEFEDFLTSSINKSPRPSALANQVLLDISINGTFPPGYTSHFGLLTSLGAVPSFIGRSFGERFSPDSADGSFFARTLSSLHLVLERELCDCLSRRSIPLGESNPNLEEYMQFCQTNDTGLTESSWMSINFSSNFSDDIDVNSIQKGPNVQTIFDKRRAAIDYTPSYTIDCLIVELKPFLIMEALYQQQSHQGKTQPSTLINFLKDRGQDPSGVRLQYFTFFGHIVPGLRVIKGCYRIQNRESVQGLELLIKSWMLSKTKGDLKRIREALDHICDEAVAGSTAYKRVYGDLWEHLADEGCGMCKITIEEIYEHIGHMKDEDPEAPGHWL